MLYLDKPIPRGDPLPEHGKQTVEVDTEPYYDIDAAETESLFFSPLSDPDWPLSEDEMSWEESAVDGLGA
jgi:hypothetical protein